MASKDDYRANVQRGLEAARLYIREKGVSEWVESFKTVKYYNLVLDRAVVDFYQGDIDEGDFIGEMIRLIEGQFTRAWNEGAASVGFDPKQMDAEDLALLKERIDAEMEFVLGFTEDINNAAANGAPIGPYRERVKLWANRYNEVVNDARLHFGKKRQHLKWELGATEEHCKTCAKLDGVVATALAWEKRGLHPQGAPNEKLECGGWRCDCKLTPTNEPLTKGGIPKV